MKGVLSKVLKLLFVVLLVINTIPVHLNADEEGVSVEETTPVVETIEETPAAEEPAQTEVAEEPPVVQEDPPAPEKPAESAPVETEKQEEPQEASLDVPAEERTAEENTETPVETEETPTQETEEPVEAKEEKIVIEYEVVFKVEEGGYVLLDVENPVKETKIVQTVSEEKAPISVKAEAEEGYEFKEWKLDDEFFSDKELIEADKIDLKKQEFTAVFEKVEETPEEKTEEPAEAKEETHVAAAPKAPATTDNAAKAGDKKPVAKPVVNRTVRVDIEKLDVLMNLVSELIIAKNSLVSSTSSDDTKQNSNFNEQIEYLESVTTNLHESVMKVRMVPIESVVSKFPRMIRDMQKSLNKKMELHMSGEETELDRTVVDEIGDPLMHLLRNSADHGLESAEVRKERGKPEVGNIYLDAYQDGNNVVIEVRDDGNGIDVEKVREKAISRGTITPEQAENMSDKEIIDLLFLPSFSTKEVVSEISGRGVGLDVVKSKIEALSGEVEVKSKLGEGSTWTVRLPLTLAIIQALMVVVGNEKYAISLGSIQTIEDISPSEIKLVQNKEVIQLRGSVIPIIRLSNVVEVESTKSPEDNLVVVIVKKGDRLAGLVVDELIGQQEIVIKSLGKYISKCKFISGATILGDGEVALILDANALI